MTKFGLDITYGFWWITCQTLSREPSDVKDNVQVHRQLPIGTSAWAWSKYREPLEGLKYKQVSLQRGLICGGNEVNADVDKINIF